MDVTILVHAAAVRNTNTATALRIHKMLAGVVKLSPSHLEGLYERENDVIPSVKHDLREIAGNYQP